MRISRLIKKIKILFANEEQYVKILRDGGGTDRVGVYYR